MNEQSKKNILNHLMQQAKIDHKIRESLEKVALADFLPALKEQVNIDTLGLENAFLDSFRQKNIFEALEKLNFLSTETLNRLKARGKGHSVLSQLVEEGLLNEDQAAKAMAICLNLEFIDLDNVELDDELFNTIDVKLMKDKLFIPLKREENLLRVVMADPSRVDDIEHIEYQVGTSIYPCIAPKPAIIKLINLMVETSLDSKLLFSDVEDSSVTIIHDEDATPETKKKSEEQQDSPVIPLVNSIILKAVRKGASDIHFEAYEKTLKVKYRIDGILHEIISNIDSPFRESIIARIKIMADLDIAEKRVPQDGRFKLKIDKRNVDFRTSILPSIHGEVAVLRILDKAFLGLNLEKIGIKGRDLTELRRNVNKPYGLLLVAGPTGSGKTTTLYSALKYIYTPESKIITIEDPVEYQMPDITQIQVNEKKGLTFASGLRSIVRQDPDKIMVGEIRDSETAGIAINAALTGHLVLSSIHANNVIDTISRLNNMDLDVYEFTSSLNLILSQRLVRKLCNNCKEVDNSITEEEKSLIQDFENHKQLKFYYGSGCRYCHRTGFKGRTGIFELLALTKEIKQLILDRVSPLLILEEAKKQGMTTLRQAAWNRLENGNTSFREINRITFEEV
ncbi:GspE/PulE family protein [Candidatus Riflebacteria bacterium]